MSKKYIIPESIKLTQLSGNINYDSIFVTPLTGEISNFIVIDSCKIIVKYDYLKINIEENKMLNPFPKIYDPNSNDQHKESNKKQNSGIYNTKQNLDFLKSGSIYRGVTLGSESGTSLQSGLNLELKGKISENIAIKGALSDQNIPIQPEGNTQKLNEIDKVYIQLGMKNEEIIFGDYNLSMGTGDYGKYNRKLQGIYCESNRDRINTKIGGAVSKGQYNTNKINGIEGNQGPYQLVGKENETAIIVLAGTEKVWIDGKQITRGENHDYIIDYSTGEITFTSRQLITSYSRITVDFQYSNLIYEKNIWYNESKVKLLDKKLNISAEFIKETDDRENPIEIDFTKEDKKLLRRIGDDLNASYKSTVQVDTNGVYTLEDSILVYQGHGSGTHSAIFYNIGRNGQYRKVYQSNLFYFQWVDKEDPTTSEHLKEEAIYLPAKPVKLPSDHKLYHVSSQFQPSQRFKVNTEYALSDLDINTFSSIDDKNNQGYAYKMDMEWQALETQFGNFSLSAKYNSVNKNFNPIDRNVDVEYSRKWDMNSDSAQGSSSFESALEYNLKSNITINVSGASFNRDNFESNRYKISGKFSYKNIKSSEIYEEKIISMKNREWLRRKGSIEFDLLNLTPFSTLYFEKKNNSASLLDDFQFLEQVYGVKLEKSQIFQWKAEYNTRTDDIKDSIGWVDNSKANNIKISTQIKNWKTFNSNFSFAKRNKTYSGQLNIPDVNFSIFNFDIRQNPKKFPISWDANMKVEKERSIKKEKLYYFVGEGKGQYRYDSTYAEYIPHSQGDYLLRIIPSPIKIPVTSIENGLRISYSGSRVKNMILKNISLMTQIRLQQEIQKDDNPLSKISWFQANNDTNQTFFYRSIFNDLNYRIPKKRINLRLRHRTSRRKSQQDVRGAENNGSDEYSVEYRGPLYKQIKLTSKITIKQTERISQINSLRNRDILAFITKNKFSYVQNRKHHFDFIITLSQDTKKENSRNIDAFLTGLKLEYEIKIIKKGRWKLFTKYNNVVVSPKNMIIPWEMCQGNQVGNTFGLGASAEYKIGKHISIRGNYESWDEPNIGLYHKGTIEIRAMF